MKIFCLLLLIFSVSFGLRRPDVSKFPENQQYKIWIPNTDFDDKSHWSSGSVPCSADTVRFPKDLNGVMVYIQPDSYNTSNKVEFHKVLLPWNGKIVLPENGQVVLGDEREKSPSCLGKEISWIPKEPFPSWLNPANWKNPSIADKDLDAVPHLERIPCGQDVAVFPTWAFQLMMPSFKIRVGALMVNDTLFFRNRYLSKLSARMLIPWAYGLSERPLELGRGFRDLIGDQCGLGITSFEGVHAQEELMEGVCQYVSCPKPPCTEPIRPNMHCCDICGAMIEIRAGNDPVLLRTVKSVVSTAIEESGDADSTAAYVGLVPPISGLIQIILIGESSHDIADVMVERIQDEIPKGVRIDLEISGILQSPATVGSVMATILGPLLAALLGFALLFYIVLGRNRIFMNSSNAPESFIFARFENIPADDITSECSATVNMPISVVPAERKASVSSARGSWTARSFMNPLFEKEKEDEEISPKMTGENALFSDLLQVDDSESLVEMKNSNELSMDLLLNDDDSTE